VAQAPGAEPSFVIVGRIRRAHGIRGEVLVEVMTDSPDAIFAPGARLFAGTTLGDPAPNAPELVVAEARPFKEALLVRFGEVPDRTTAELWRDRYLLVPLDEIDAPEEDEVFIHDLIGLTVVLADGSPIGRVASTLETGAGLLLEIHRPHDVVLMPYELEFIQEIDVEGGRLVVDPPAGMFDPDAD
jgi:16S rRNA processing protein RimM